MIDYEKHGHHECKSPPKGTIWLLNWGRLFAPTIKEMETAQENTWASPYSYFGIINALISSGI